jgi:AcrR family transcriptional regulator
VPKIRAATVAQHREMQRIALLQAARALLAEGGIDALNFPALASRTGLARSSVYHYFRSRAAVVEELFAADFPQWAVEIENAMAAAGPPLRQVEAYVRTQLSLACGPRHRAVVAIAAAELDGAARERIRAVHGRLADLVVTALRELGHEQPALTAALLQGMVQTAVRRLERAPGRGAGEYAAQDPQLVVAAAVALALHGAAGVRGTS